MKTNRLNDYLKVIENNELIKKLYSKVADLEIADKLDSDEAQNLIAIIKRLTDNNMNLLKKHPIRDNTIEEFKILLEDLNINLYNDDYVEYIKNDSNFKLKMFMEQINFLELLDRDYSEEYLMDMSSRYIKIDSVKYPIKQAISLLKQAGHKKHAKQLEEVINNAYEETKKLEINEAIFEYNRLGLIEHTMMYYLNEAINDPANNSIKNNLIKFKYNMITLYNPLSKEYLKNPKDFVNTGDFQKELIVSHMIDKDTFEMYDKRYKDVINGILVWLIEEEQHKRNKLDEVLALVYLKTYNSLISNKEDIKEIDFDKIAAFEMTDDIYNKYLINGSFKLNQNLILAKKIHK